MRFVKVILLTMALAVALGAARFGLEQAGKIVRLNDPEISPDGKSIAVAVSRANFEENRWDAELVLIDVATHSQ